MTAIQRWFFMDEGSVAPVYVPGCASFEYQTPADPPGLQVALEDQWCKAKDVAELEKLLATYVGTIAELRRDRLTPKQADALLAHCPVGECAICSQIICPHQDSMHFHHDGCPSCTIAVSQ